MVLGDMHCEKQSKFPRYNIKCRGKPDTTWNIPRGITFSLLHFILYRGKSISFGTVWDKEYCEQYTVMSIPELSTGYCVQGQQGVRGAGWHGQGVQCTVYMNCKPVIVYRGNKGFVALGDMDKEYYTGLPDGEYCDLISECAQKVQVVKGWPKLKQIVQNMCSTHWVITSRWAKPCRLL